LRIAFNTLSENPSKPSGSVDFFVQMTHKLVDSDKGNRYFIFCSKTNKHLFADLEPQAKVVIAGQSNENRLARILTEQFLIPVLLKRYRIDILFTSSGGGAVPVLAPSSTRIISAVYGTHHLKDDLNIGLVRRTYRNWMTKISAWKSAIVVVNSESCKSDVVNRMELPENKLRMIYHGIDLGVFNPADLDPEEEEILASRDVKPPFILFVSVIWFYKNAHTLVEAFGKLASRDEISNDVELVLVGNFDLSSGLKFDHDYRGMLDQIADKYNVKDRTKYVGFVANNRLRAFYRSAAVYIQPSFHETFGKTVVEAMACGCPVIGADNSSTAEILRGYGLLFSTKDSDELASLIARLFREPGLADEMRVKSLEHAQMFSAEAEVDSFVSLFNELQYENS